MKIGENNALLHISNQIAVYGHIWQTPFCGPNQMSWFAMQTTFQTFDQID